MKDRKLVCGLTGILLAQPVERNLLESRLKTMIATLRHRGPDDEGLWSDRRVGLAFARLSIIDLSSIGHQPMSDAEGRIWLVFNGEIYNFQLLRRELEAKGYRFRSRTDSEVIIHGYKEWGEAVIGRLRGMFAIALWDRQKQKLLLARDRLGKKPLFYAATGSGLIFGSEIKAILAWPGVSREPDLVAIHHYLSYQYVPAPHTAFQSVRCLPPAHLMTVEVDPDGRARPPKLTRYWRATEPKLAKRAASDAELCEELIERLQESVRLRMVADVPLGAFLSGGVDSSAVVAMMAKTGGKIKTFCMGFENPQYDETAYARQVADRYATDHHEMIVKPDAVAILPQLVWHYNQPFADPSAVPTYYLAQLARRHVTVTLNGDGGDECFAGYGRYATMRRLSLFDDVPDWIKGPSTFVLDRIPGPARFAQQCSGIASLLRGSSIAPEQRYAFTITSFMDHMKQEGYGAALRNQLAHSSMDILRPYFEEAPDLVSGANWADIHTYLPDDLMTKVDVATMAHALESRSPLLDHEFVEWASSIGMNRRMRRGVTKSIFKKAMEPYLPAAVLYRPKMGFGCPIDHWLRNELKEMAYDLLLSRRFAERQLFEPAYVRRILDAHCEGTEDHHTRLWGLLMLELWYRMWVDSPSTAARPIELMGIA
jgi:asparagine synthase (glutamine-hydrolysing)